MARIIRFLELARKIAAEQSKAADLSAVTAEGRERRVIALIITVAYHSQTLQPFQTTRQTSGRKAACHGLVHAHLG